MTQDMKITEFKKACAEYGFKQKYCGVYKLPNGGLVNIYNAGTRRREQLKYMIKESEKK